MSNMFYPKLTVTNIKKNGKFYFPYMLTCVGTIAMFYIMCSITFNDGLNSIPHNDSLKIILHLGCTVIGLFSVIFLLYTNSFLMKRRKKEFGLFNILGMEKRHISKIMTYETLIISFISVLLGITVGILFGKLIMMALFKFLSFKVSINSSISSKGLIISVILFSAIFLLTLLTNLAKMHLSNPIELLRGGNTGEKEPKTKIILAILGFACVGTGYYIAIVTKSPLQALTLFFLAVVLVIIGTYCLFTAGSIAVLKLMRKNKKYYYKTSHFISVSGMLYRMKQNAVGLANICILSTMVLVMISTTVCLYIGVDDGLVKRYPTDISIEKYYTGEFKENDEQIILDIKKELDLLGKNKYHDFKDYRYLSFTAVLSDSGLNMDSDNFSVFQQADSKSLQSFFVITADDYERMTGKHVSLTGNNIITKTNKEVFKKSISFLGHEYIVQDTFSDELINDEALSMFSSITYIVVADNNTINEIYNIQHEAYGKNASDITYYAEFNCDGSREQKLDYFRIVQSSLNTDKYARINLLSREDVRKEFYNLYGGLLFLGAFLGILFIMATVLIIYYKQISEGYDDKDRYNVMQKVGMNKDEVKQTIRSQVITVFFLPLITAAIHVIAAFPMIERLIALFNLTNTSLFMLCTAITVAVFAVIYGIVYSLTAKVYYKIVD